jgi:predicted nucleotidyltransferase
VDTSARLPDLPEEVQPVLTLLRERIQAVLGDQLVGLYLYGSLSSGDFDPASSDVDFVAVTEDAPPAETCERLRKMHARIATSGLPFATHLEGSYIPREAWRRYDPANARHPTIGVDWPFQIGLHDANWIIERAIVRERGVVLAGPPPATLIDPVSPAQLRAAICQQMSDVWQTRIADDEWPRPRLYPALAVLTLCRALYTVERGAYCSKPVAAAWASERYPTWRPTIAWALAHRADHDNTTPAELADALAMLREALVAVQTRCP